MSKFPRRSFFFLLLFTLSFYLISCDSGGSNDAPADPSFSFSISGEATDASFSGRARWAVNAAVEDEDGFGINFSGEDGTDQGLMVSGTNRPGKGTYSVRDISDTGVDLTASPDFGFYFVDGQSDTSIQYVSNSGTVTITESTDKRVTGRVEIITTRVDPANPNQTETTATVTGTFDAAYAASGAGIFAPAP